MTYRLSRDVTTAECPWLDRDFAAGEIVHRYSGHTYGIISPSGVACCDEEGTTPFYEIPIDALEVGQ